MKRNLVLRFGSSLAAGAFGLTLLWCLAASTSGQPQAQSAQTSSPSAQAPAAPKMPTAPVIKKESRLVLVDAVVTDKKGDYVSDLKPYNFRLYVDNK